MFHLNSLNFPNKKNIVILDNEYGSNLIYYKKRNLNYRVVKINNGKVCFKDLETKIDSKTFLVSVCQFVKVLSQNKCHNFGAPVLAKALHEFLRVFKFVGVVFL